MINAIHVTLPRHELEALIVAANQKVNRNPSSQSAEWLDSAVARIEAALAEADKAPYFRRFWEDNQNLLWGEARESFELILKDRGLDWFKQAYAEQDAAAAGPFPIAD